MSTLIYSVIYLRATNYRSKRSLTGKVFDKVQEVFEAAVSFGRPRGIPSSVPLLSVLPWL